MLGVSSSETGRVGQTGMIPLRAALESNRRTDCLISGARFGEQRGCEETRWGGEHSAGDVDVSLAVAFTAKSVWSFPREISIDGDSFASHSFRS